jgi:hypothetical protein
LLTHGASGPHLLSRLSALAALQFVTASGTSLPMHSGINRRLLTATTPEFLSSLVTPSRRAVLQSLEAAGEGGAQAHHQEQWQQQEGSQLASYALPAWETQSDRAPARQLLYNDDCVLW